MLEHLPLPRVKVCGLTRADDARCALAAGANALGFVFHPASPRCADAVLVREFVAHLPESVWTVAVVVDTDPTRARALLDQTGLCALQLCGDQRASEWSDFDAPLLRRIGVEESARAQLDAWSSIASLFVLDHPASAGGSGREVDHALAASFCAQHPCLLAGGLDGARVAAAIRAVRPAGVDAASRLERRPGLKDHAAVEAFVTTALETFADLHA